MATASRHRAFATFNIYRIVDDHVFPPVSLVYDHLCVMDPSRYNLDRITSGNDYIVTCSFFFSPGRHRIEFLKELRLCEPVL